MDTATTALPSIVSREEWAIARARLLDREKAALRMKDAVSAERRRLPMVEVTERYVFQGETGPATLLDLFDGRRQLILQHFMFHPEWDEGCVGCSMMADHVGPLAHLHARNTSYVAVSRAPLEKLLAYRARMGWEFPWYSSHDSTFNKDFRVTVNDEEDSAISVFLRDGDRVFHTWQTFGRGVEPIITMYDYLDFTPLGRQEPWEDSPAGWPQDAAIDWWRRHDRYDTDGREPDCPGCES
jgi:predicted dithiol-disulfide oxidoreductase (DUF899 family)